MISPRELEALREQFRECTDFILDILLSDVSEIAALRRQVAERVVEIPELTAKDAETLARQCEKARTPHYAMAFLMHKWIASRVTVRAPSADVVSPRPADMWAIHWSPGCWDLHEDRHEAEAVARTGICDLVPLWMHEPPGETDMVTMPREEWTVAQILANAWSRHPLTCGERDKLVAEWDALRSGDAGTKEGAST